MDEAWAQLLNELVGKRIGSVRRTRTHQRLRRRDGYVRGGSIVDERKKAMPLSRQRMWQLKMRRRHRCIQCGSTALLTKFRCLRCVLVQRAHNRKRYGCKAWRPGGQGVPPIEVRLALASRRRASR